MRIQSTQTVGNALKPYGLIYDMVTNFKVPVNWAINPAETTFRLDAGNTIPVDFTATIKTGPTTTGPKSYAGGSFIIDGAFLTPAVIADINTWKAQGVVVDTLGADLTTEIYGQATSFPLAVLDAQNGKLAIPYFSNAGVPASAYSIGIPTNLDHCDDVFILTHADPDNWPVAYHQALYNFVVNGGGLWAGCHSVAEIENLFAGANQLNFLSNGGVVPFGSHSDGTPPYLYNSLAANDPIMQIMNRLDAATQNGSEQIYVPTTLDWRSTTTVAVFDPDQPNNPADGTSPFNKAAVIAYGNAFGDPTKGLVMYEGGHSLAGTAAANIAAQRAFFNFILTEGIIKAPKPTLTIPTIVAGQTATLTATITGGSGSYSYQWVSPNARPDLVITKADGGTSTLPGGIVLYQITYTNVGTQNANGVLITETLPANTTFNSAYSFNTWESLGGDLFGQLIGDLPIGASGTVTFAVNVKNPLPVGVTQIFNSVSITDGGASGADLNPANNTATDTTPIVITPAADLQITKTNNLTSVQPGNVVTYTVTVTNAGPNAVTGATFTDNVPASLTGVSYATTVSGGATVTSVIGSGNSISGSLNLPVGSTVTYSITGTLNPNATGTLTNLATILPPAGVLDPNTGNNTAVDSDPIVPVSDLSLAKTFTFTDLDGSGTITAGDRIVFAVTVTNSGPNQARNIAVEDLLPNGYTYVSDDAAVNGGTYSIGTGLWTLGTTLGATAPNNTTLLHITAIVGPGGTYTNAAEIVASGSRDPDSTPDNSELFPAEDDTASVTPIVQPKSDLSLDKTMIVNLNDDINVDLDHNDILSIGDRVTFTLTLHNLGPNDAANVHVADLLPAGYLFFGFTASQGSYTSATGDWNVGTVGVLATPTLSIVATMVGGRPASAYVNYAQVSASGSFDPDSTPGDKSTTQDDDASVAPFIADLSVTKTAALANDADASSTLTVGDDVVFTVTIANAGPDFATGVQLVDLLTAGYTYVSDDSPATYDPITGQWLVGGMAPGTTQVLNITATVNPTGPYTNTAQVTASQQFDPNSTPNNNVASENDQASITLNPGAAAQPPVAVNDSSLHNPAGPVTLNVTANDTDPNLDLNVATVDLNSGVAGQQTTRVVAGEGTWTVDTLGYVTFTPQAGFTHDPTPITYVVQDATAKTSNQATITIDYVPVASNDSSIGNPTGSAVTVPVLSNDTTGDATVPSTGQIFGTPGPGVSLVMPGEGTWSVNTTTGAITFTPAPGYTGDPTPIQYAVQDAQGNTSNSATVTVDFVQLPPVAVDDSSLNNQPGPVTLSVIANDTDRNNDVDPSTVDLDPLAPGQQTTRIVPGEGFWQVDNSGNVTFFPNVGFTQETPTPITYNVKDRTGLQSNVATITYVPRADLSLTKTVDNPTRRRHLSEAAAGRPASHQGCRQRAAQRR